MKLMEFRCGIIIASYDLANNFMPQCGIFEGDYVGVR